MKEREVRVVTEDDRFNFEFEVGLAVSGYPDNATFNIEYNFYGGIYSALIFIEFVEEEI